MIPAARDIPFRIVLGTLLVSLVIAFLGCATKGGESQLVEQVAIQYAVMKVIDKNPERAARIHTIVTEAKTFLDNDSVTLGVVQEVIHDKIDWTKLDAADTLLVNALLAEVDRQLAAKFGSGVLSPEARIRINVVLDWVIAVTG